MLQTEIRTHNESGKQISLRLGKRAILAVIPTPVFRAGYDTLEFSEVKAKDTLALTSWIEGWEIVHGILQPVYGTDQFVSFTAIARTLSEGGSLKSIDPQEEHASLESE